MGKVAVVYWSGTGNTQKMAEIIAESAGATLLMADEFKSEMVDEYAAIGFGCPSMGAEELEESEFEPMFSACKDRLSEKSIALFGSYGWGDGEWMRTWEEDCLGVGAKLVYESVICQEEPDADAEAACKALGEALKKA